MTNKKIAYKDTFLTFYNYKEPLRPVKKGFGYQGAVLGTLDGTAIQCHVCGELFKSLANHVKTNHGYKRLADYKTEFGLAKETALVSESLRDEMKMKTLLWWKDSSEEEKKKVHEARKKRFEEYIESERFKEQNERRWNISLETKNKRGTCPDQLLEKINKVAKELGHTPSKKEFIDYWDSQRYVHLIYATFGSWENGIKRAGLLPKIQDRSGGWRKYEDEELLDLLNVFHQETGKIPSYTDCRRGILPDAGVYIRHFGSLKKARVLAGIHELPTRWKTNL